MNKEFIKKVVGNNFIVILFEILIITLITNDFFDSFLGSYDWKSIAFLGLTQLIIMALCSVVFSYRYNDFLKFGNIQKYYFTSFVVFNFFVALVIFSLPVFSNNFLVFFVVFVGLGLISLLIAFIDFKIRSFNNKNKTIRGF